LLTGLSGSPAIPAIRVAHKHKSCALRPVVTILEAAIDSLTVSSLVMERISGEIRSTEDFPDRPEGICETSTGGTSGATVGGDAPRGLW
jgi:hypothetical protein